MAKTHMTSDNKKMEVERMMKTAVDVTDELEYQQFIEQCAINRWQPVLDTFTRLKHPRAVETAIKVQAHVDELTRLTVLLAVAKTIICEHCGGLVENGEHSADGCYDPDNRNEIPF